MTDLELIAALMARGLAVIADVVPPSTSVDVVGFDVDVADPDAAAAMLGAYASGTLEGNLRAFADSMRRLRRMVRQARGGDARPESPR